MRSNTPCPGSTFSCTDCLVHTNRAGGSPLTDGGFFAEPQLEYAAYGGGNVPRPAAGQEGRHQGFYPLNSHFLLFVSLAQIRDRRPLRKRGTAEDFYYRRGAQCAPISLPLRSAGFRTATHIGSSTQARHTRVAQLVCSVVMDGICGFCLITDDTVGCDLGAPLVTYLHLA